MTIKIQTIEDVVNYQLCTGCGACAGILPERYQMHDIESVGRRPKIVGETNGANALAVCPGHKLQHDLPEQSSGYDSNLLPAWGPVIDVWEGYAADDKIRFKGSSGGAATALAAFAIESGAAGGALHTVKDKAKPYLNTTQYSTSKAELLENAGSRYATASPCEKISEIANRAGASVFIGKPCDVAAVKKLEDIDPSFKDKVAVKIGFFCAGVPSTEGNLALLEQQGMSKDKLVDLKYRGEGWPGMWRATTLDGEEKSIKEMTYADSWGFLQKYRQWRCYICPDHTAEFADIAVGDPWYREIKEGEAGKSLIVVRSQKGRAFLKKAVDAGYIVLERKDNSLLPRSQPNLIKARGSLWGRLIVLSLSKCAVPEYKGFQMFRYWLNSLSLQEKAQSIYGTLKRVKAKSLKYSLNLFENTKSG